MATAFEQCNQQICRINIQAYIRSKAFNFSIETDENLPGFIETDSQRLNQILKNLLSNSFKFTEKGSVNLKIHQADKNWKSKNPNLDSAETVIAFEISDTGIGI